MAYHKILKPKQLNQVYHLIQRIESIMGKMKPISKYDHHISTLLSELEDTVVRASTSYERRNR